MRQTRFASPFQHRQLGFTLIELMIVVALVAVLATFAIPSYRQHAMKSNRAAAEAFMQQVANRQEQYVLNARTYATSLPALNLTPPADVSTKYNFSITPTAAAPSNTNYTITAVPIGGQVNDTTCGTIGLDQSGKKGAICSVDASGNLQCTGPASVCW